MTWSSPENVQGSNAPIFQVPLKHASRTPRFLAPPLPSWAFFLATRQEENGEVPEEGEEGAEGEEGEQGEEGEEALEAAEGAEDAHLGFNQCHLVRMRI